MAFVQSLSPVFTIPYSWLVGMKLWAGTTVSESQDTALTIPTQSQAPPSAGLHRVAPVLSPLYWGHVTESRGLMMTLA